MLYGVLGGFGLGLIYLPAVVAVGYYFDSKRALATGLIIMIMVTVVMIGSMIMTMVMLWLTHIDQCEGLIALKMMLVMGFRYILTNLLVEEEKLQILRHGNAVTYISDQCVGLAATTLLITNMMVFAGISVCGSGVGTFIFAPLATWLLEQWVLDRDDDGGDDNNEENGDGDNDDLHLVLFSIHDNDALNNAQHSTII